jgi:hypothetical protein
MGKSNRQYIENRNLCVQRAVQVDKILMHYEKTFIAFPFYATDAECSG